jgi:hypothetical protein
MTCKKCNKTFSCGCQKTQASDGSTVHKTCLGEYEAMLQATKK